jgi:hypothetical protein
VEGQDFSLVLDSDGIGKSGILRAISNALVLFPSDLVYFRGSGGLSYRKPSFWPRGYGNIKVQYTYGFAPGSVPDDIKLAIAVGCAICANTTKYGFPIVGENLGAHSYSLGFAREPEFGTVRQLLSRYRDLSIGGGR